MKYQVVKLSALHPTSHAASEFIIDDTKHECMAMCGQHLREDSLLALPEKATCSKCVRMLERAVDPEQVYQGKPYIL